MTVICNVKREITVRSWMAANQPVILITDPYLHHCSLKNCRLPFIGIQYRIVMGIILKVVIIWNFKESIYNHKVYNFRLEAGSYAVCRTFRIHSCGISECQIFSGKDAG